MEKSERQVDFFYLSRVGRTKGRRKNRKEGREEWKENHKTRRSLAKDK
jgi:hypothetical protein